MQVTVTCPHCGQSVTLAEEFLGTSSRCPHADCGQRFVPDRARGADAREPAAVGVGALEGLHFGDNGSGSRPSLAALAAATGGSAEFPVPIMPEPAAEHEPAGIPDFGAAAPAPVPVSAPAPAFAASMSKSKPAAPAKPAAKPAVVRKAQERPMAVPLLAGAIVAVIIGPLAGLLKYSVPIPLVFTLAAGVAVGWTIAIMAGSKTGKVSPLLLVQCITIGGATGLIAALTQYWAVKRNLTDFVRKMPVTLELPEVEGRFTESFSFLDRYLKLRAAGRFSVPVESKWRSDEFDAPDAALAEQVAGAVTAAGVRLNPMQTSVPAEGEERSNPAAIRAFGKRVVFSAWVESAGDRAKAVKAAAETAGVKEVDDRNLTDETGAACWELSWSFLQKYGGAQLKNFNKAPSFDTEFGRSGNNLAQWTADCLQHKVRGSWRFQSGPLEPSGRFFYALFYMEIALAAIVAAIVYAHFVGRRAVAEPTADNGVKSAAA